MMKMVITGGTGLVGSRLRKDLTEWEIIVLTRIADIRLLSVAWVKTEDNNLNNNWVILHGRHL